MEENKVILRKNIPLSKYSNYKIGGPADYFFEAKKVDEIIKALDKWRSFRTSRNKKNNIFILGAGTNILFDDKGYKGLIIKPKIEFIKKDGRDNLLLRVGAGVLMRNLLNFAISKNLSGLEWAGGLPGTLGGAIRGNAGAFGGKTKDIIKEVVSLDISGRNPKIVRRKNKECDFGYRSSIFKKQSLGKLGTREIIIEAVLVFKKGDKKSIKEIADKNVNYRKEKQPLEYPNIGSIFKNVNLKKIPKNKKKEFSAVIKTDPFPVMPAAHLISEAGLKGACFGGAMVSPKHPNFIVNVSKATSSDVENLIKLVKKKVKSKFGVELEEEIGYLK
jgi:UDP-N-acetylmuramate dehydrogenase